MATLFRKLKAVSQTDGPPAPDFLSDRLCLPLQILFQYAARHDPLTIEQILEVVQGDCASPSLLKSASEQTDGKDQSMLD